MQPDFHLHLDAIVYVRQILQILYPDIYFLGDIRCISATQVNSNSTSLDQQSQNALASNGSTQKIATLDVDPKVAIIQLLDLAKIERNRLS